MVKAVVFDLFETLVTQSGTAVPRAGALGAALGLDAIAYRKEWKRLRPLVLRGELTFADALTKVGTTLGIAIPADRVQHARDERMRANETVFEKADAELVTLTRDLRARGVRLATISNCIAEDVTGWPGCAFAPQFECAVFSYAAGAVKPDPRIYLDATGQLGVKPEDTLYVGDGGDDELAGAERAGLRAAQASWFVSRAASAGVPVLSDWYDVMRLVADG
jgi:HAD superfamily hydrolase (TIGR01509 family)